MSEQEILSLGRRVQLKCSHLHSQRAFVCDSTASSLFFSFHIAIITAMYLHFSVVSGKSALHRCADPVPSRFALQAATNSFEQGHPSPLEKAKEDMPMLSNPGQPSIARNWTYDTSTSCARSLVSSSLDLRNTSQPVRPAYSDGHPVLKSSPL